MVNWRMFRKANSQYRKVVEREVPLEISLEKPGCDRESGRKKGGRKRVYHAHYLIRHNYAQQLYRKKGLSEVGRKECEDKGWVMEGNKETTVRKLRHNL